MLRQRKDNLTGAVISGSENALANKDGGFLPFRKNYIFHREGNRGAPSALKIGVLRACSHFPNQGARCAGEP